MNPIAHIEINVSNLKQSTEFYLKILSFLGWKQFNVGHPDVVGFQTADQTKLFLVQTEEKFVTSSFHRKQVGLNHIALRVESVEQVDKFAEFLNQNNISRLYSERSKDYTSEYCEEKYYAVFFEDPDRLKVEVVYCK